jgi:adenylate cyclase class 1
MDCRQNKDDYPVHISDLDVPCSYLGVEDNNQLQTVHYLNYKKKIEAKLNV